MTFATPQLPLFEVDFGALFASVNGHVRNSRSLKRQPPLEPNGEILIGQEKVRSERSAPSIVIVPTGVKVKSVRRNIDAIDPLPFFSQWLLFECHCWGDDNEVDQAYSFSSSLELGRQLIVAFVLAAAGGKVARGETHTLVENVEFRQKTDINRQGRMLVFTIAQEAFLVQDESILMTPATATVPGVQIAMQVFSGEPPPGTSEPAGNPILVPTGPNG